MKKKNKISEEQILEITNKVIKNKAWLTTIENEVPELLETVKYWKNQHDDLLTYLNEELKPKANKIIECADDLMTIIERYINLVNNDAKTKI